MLRYASIVLALSLCSGPLRANSLVVNGSFEDPASNGSPSLGLGSTYLTGWTVIDAEIAQLRNVDFPLLFPSDGTYSLDLTGYHDGTPWGGVEQIIATILGATYAIHFDTRGTTAVTVSAGDLHAVGSGTGQDWTTYNGFFTALDSSTTISLIGLTGGNYIGLDNVIVNLDHLASTVPEPGTIWMIASGLVLAGLGRVRRFPARR